MRCSRARPRRVREEEETGDYPALDTSEFEPAIVGQSEEVWLDQQQCQDFDWGD